jgi:hypothetical protein
MYCCVWLARASIQLSLALKSTVHIREFSLRGIKQSCVTIVRSDRRRAKGILLDTALEPEKFSTATTDETERTLHLR